MNTPMIDILLADTDFIPTLVRVVVWREGDDNRFATLDLTALAKEVATLTRERDGLLVINGDLARDNDTLIAERDALRDATAVDAARQSITVMRTPSLCCDGENRDYIIGFKSGYAEARDDAIQILDAARTADAPTATDVLFPGAA